MLTGIDHLIIASSDPEVGVGEIERVFGLRPSGGGRHDAHGTFNRLIWLGDSYLELMGVFDADLAGQSWWGAHIVRLLSAGPSALAGIALASDNLAADVNRLREMGSPISDPLDGERTRPDGDVVRWRIGRQPAPDDDLGLAFLIEHDTTAAEWRPADREARAKEQHPIGTPARLARVELPVTDIGDANLRLLRTLGLQFRPSLAGRGARDTTIGTQTLRLVSGADLHPQVTLKAGYEELNLELLGLRWQLLRA